MALNLQKFEEDVFWENNCSVNEYFFEPGRYIPLHWHDYLEFEFIVSGQMRHIYNNKEYILEPGSAYLMCYYDFHELTTLTDVHMYSIHFDKSLLASDLAQSLGYNKFHCNFDETETRFLEQKMKELLKESEEKHPFYALNIKSKINEIVISMIRKATSNEVISTPLPIQQAVTYISEHFLEQITLKELSNQLSFSTNYLGMLFKKQMNCTFNEYLNTLRLKYACNLLSSSDISVKEISYASGYSSVEYFMYAFKKKMLMTPIEYRNQQRDKH